MAADGTGELFAVAPMLDVTTSAFRRFARLLTADAVLYTEMIPAEALCRGRTGLLAFDSSELPCVAQLGGADPGRLALAAKIAADAGYSAINLNAGCPSERVGRGAFGAVLMKTPDRLARCLESMRTAVGVPVTVKTRIGVDDLDSAEFTVKLVGALARAGCGHVILHARKAWLNGLSPKENRSLPPLDYERVFLIKREFPRLRITLNGGLKTVPECLKALELVDGVMLGRAVRDSPYLLAQVDSRVYGRERPVKSRDQVLDELADLTEAFMSEGHPARLLLRHALNLFNGCPGARRFRRCLAEHLGDKDAGPGLLSRARRHMLEA